MNLGRLGFGHHARAFREERGGRLGRTRRRASASIHLKRESVTFRGEKKERERVLSRALLLCTCARLCIMYTISKEYARTALAHNGTIGVFVLSVRARAF